jgi:uncharacterized protein
MTGLRDTGVGELLWVADKVRATAPLAASPLHGERHWQAVARIGGRLAAETPGADLRAVLLFALLHDARRENDHHDPNHGPRAAQLLDSYAAAGRVVLPEPVRERLRDAIARHDAGAVSDDPLTGVCWDADRLCLSRVGIEPDPGLLSTRAGRDHRGCASRLLAQPLVDWAALLTPIVPTPDARGGQDAVLDGGRR